jgi:hypothetical protein
MVLLVVALVALSCKRKNPTGELLPPREAPRWESRFGSAYDDAYTREHITLEGRAPHDVLDQRLFAARLGHASLVALVEVEQVWGRGRYQSQPDQYLGVKLGEVLLGELPGDAAGQQQLLVRAEDDLPGTLHGQEMILFLRWAPGEDPPYHHHLMPADEDTVEYIRAMVNHAKEEGVLTFKGKERRGKQRRRIRRERRATEKAGAEVTPDED